MKRLQVILFACFCCFATVYAQPASTPPAESARTAPAPSSSDTSTANTAEAEKDLHTKEAVAAQATKGTFKHDPNFLEHIVDSILARFDVRSTENTPTRYLIALGFVIVALLLRRVVTTVFFGILKKFAERTETTLDDKLFPALEAPVGLLIVVTGFVSALKVLKTSDQTDDAVNYGSTIAFSLCFFWLFLRAFNTILEHAEEVARSKQLGIAAFMPWIKKTLLTVFVVFGILMVAQSLGADVKAFLAGLGIGGLAFALAAQDTIANLFGSVVVAIDQPFKLGEFVQIGAHGGTVEDIGLRSTKLRKADKSLVVIPNKTVAAEAVVNLSRFTQRRVEQTLGLTYDTTAEQMETIVNEIREIILAEPGIDRPSVVVQFTAFNDSSLDVTVVYQTVDPDYVKHLKLRERLNLKFMRTVQKLGASFAFPTRTIQLDGPIARKLTEKQNERL